MLGRDFQKGVDILSDLFVETSSPIYVYNQGRCYQQNNRWEQAIGRFREYLRIAKDLTDSDKADADQQIADCERSLGKSAQLAPPPAVAAPPPIARTETLRQSPRRNTSGCGRAGGHCRLRTTTARVYARGSGLRSRWAGCGRRRGWIGLEDTSISSDEQKHVATVDKENERKSLETWGWVSYGVGAAAIATARFSTSSADRATTRAALPSCHPGP